MVRIEKQGRDIRVSRPIFVPTERRSLPLQQETKGWLYGLVGVISFSLTLPATRAAVASFSPIFVALGRALVAAILAALYLRLKGRRFPKADLKGLIIVCFGVILGFPLLSAWAVARVPASHGAVILGLLPLATAGAGALRANERPSTRFWLTSLVGSAVVVAFALQSGAGQLQVADLALVGAVIAAAFGYAEGGRLARHLGGLEVISWALVISAPVIVWPVLAEIVRHGLSATATSWLGFGYVSLVSQFLGFAAWYLGLALGGVAKVGQTQLLQPFFTILASALLLGEQLTPITLGAAVLVALVVALGRKAAVATASPAQR